MRNCCEKGEGLWDQDLMIRYRKIPKISPGAYFRREISGGKFAFQFAFVFKGNFPNKPPRGRGLYLEGRFNGGFFALAAWEAYIWSGLFMEGLILRYSEKKNIIMREKRF